MEASVRGLDRVRVGLKAGVGGVRVGPKFGLNDTAENVAVVPDGTPVAESDTDCVVPETRPTVTGYDPDCPAVTLPLPAVEMEKSKTGAGVPPVPANS